MGAMGMTHWLILGIIILLLFGNRLPSVMRSLGQGVTEFKKGMEGITDERDAGSKQESRPAEHETAQK